MLATTTVLALVVLAVPNAAVAAPPAVPFGPPTPTAAVSAALQRDLHLDAGQIPTRLARQAAAPTAEQALRTTLGAGFGGLWLSDDGTANVGVTSGASAREVKAAGATARTVTYSEQQLKAAMDGLNQAKAVPDSVSEWYVDLPTNRIVITVQPGHTGDAEAFAARAGVGKEIVRMVTSSQQPRPTIDLYGGDGFSWGFGGKCTVGFAVTGGFITAGHCYEGIFYSGVNGPGGYPLGSWRASSFPKVDYGWIATGVIYTPIPQVDVLGGVAGTREAVVGTAVCRSGQSTGVHCGRILSKDYTADYKDNGGKVYGLTRTDACSEPGDSGGPFMPAIRRRASPPAERATAAAVRLTPISSRSTRSCPRTASRSVR